MCIASWVVYILIGSNRDRKIRETKTASYLNRAHLIMMNVLYRIQMYLLILDPTKSGTTIVIILHSIGIIIFERT